MHLEEETMLIKAVGGVGENKEKKTEVEVVR